MADAAPAPTLTVVTTVAGLALGGWAAYRFFGRDVSVLGLVPLLIVGGLVGRAAGEAWTPTHLVTAGAAPP